MILKSADVLERPVPFTAFEMYLETNRQRWLAGDRGSLRWVVFSTLPFKCAVAVTLPSASVRQSLAAAPVRSRADARSRTRST
jgi:hypothetical protein